MHWSPCWPPQPQLPFVHVPLQQSLLNVHESPSWWQPHVLPTHVCVQQSLPKKHMSPSCVQLEAAPHVPWLLHWPVQQLFGPPWHGWPSGMHCGAPQRPCVHWPEQQPAGPFWHA